MKQLLRTASVAWTLVLAAMLSQTLGTTALAQVPSVPWAEVPPELKEAIRLQAEARGQPWGLKFSGGCETGQGGQLCARVTTLQSDRARVGVGLYQAEAEFWIFVRSDGRWVLEMAPPPTGTGIMRSSSATPRVLYLLGGGFLGVSVVLGLVARWRGRRTRSLGRT